jgi:hypothetical protein
MGKPKKAGNGEGTADLAYASARARVLESKLREPSSMPPEQVIKEYALSEKDIDSVLEGLMAGSLAEFSESAPGAVRPFSLMADMENVKAFVRTMKTKGDAGGYSKLGVFLGASEEEAKERLQNGHAELAQKLHWLIGLRLTESDRFIENYFTKKIGNRLFSDHLAQKRDYLKKGYAPEHFYAKLAELAKGRSMVKGMGEDVVVAYLLLRQREIELARGSALAAVLKANGVSGGGAKKLGRAQRSG